VFDAASVVAEPRRRRGPKHNVPGAQNEAHRPYHWQRADAQSDPPYLRLGE
jgi:hypothetical protein